MNGWHVLIGVVLVVAGAALLHWWLGRGARATAAAELRGVEARADQAHAEHVEEVTELSDQDLLDAIATTKRPRP